MDKTFENSSETHVDSGALDQSAWNSRTPSMDPEEEVVKLDEEYYDMSGDKILVILNQRKFKNTRHSKGQPPLRRGTNEDKKKLEKIFTELGFTVIVMHNHQYHSIMQKLTAIAASDHTRTSCICVTILTHGGPGGQVFAAERPYLLSEVMNIFANEPSLVGKPKLYLVQACRGQLRDAGQTVHVGREIDGVPAKPTSHKPSLQDFEDSIETDADSTDRFDSQSNGVLTFPSHADTLVLYACAEGYVSQRNSNGSWLIQALCRQIQLLYKTHDIHSIITKVNAEVARKTSTSKWPEKNNKKQMPEIKYNLMKMFKF